MKVILKQQTNLLLLLLMIFSFVLIVFSNYYLGLSERVSSILTTAGIVLFASTIVLWILMYSLESKFQAFVSEQIVYMEKTLSRMSPRKAISGIYFNQREALQTNIHFFEIETESITLVGTTLKWLIMDERLSKLLLAKAKQGCKVNVILSSPKFIEIREQQESRAPDALRNELLNSINFLKDLGNKNIDVRVLHGVLTYSAMITSKVVLLSPYLLSRDAFRSFVIFVNREDNREADELYETVKEDYLRAWNTSYFLEEVNKMK